MHPTKVHVGRKHVVTKSAHAHPSKQHWTRYVPDAALVLRQASTDTVVMGKLRALCADQRPVHNLTDQEVLDCAADMIHKGILHIEMKDHFVATASNFDPASQQSEDDFKQNEGCVEYMYLDSKCKVTVGIGVLLPNAAAAKALKFVHQADGKPATDAEKEAAFNAVQKLATPLKKGESNKFGAAHYKKTTTIILPDDEILRLFKAMIPQYEAMAKKIFFEFDAFPVPVKRAILDLVYNMGQTGLDRYQKHGLVKAIEDWDWDQASKLCARSWVNDDRNDWTKERFLEAAKNK
ncbi:hypothetical protein GCM10011611_39190 [Aliidongia dinghuensis]|uniref:Lysozyme n=1 Tax=Aliidongia dinghuensis TaxID=1867774 RepID=A0A8J2YWU9_9PROT|nr:hypothetical protein [Aliidongia dinghuensis]GGF29305.1 hypothetical protein GCM10011611_39190 [Aliidongia dinghuensis]